MKIKMWNANFSFDLKKKMCISSFSIYITFTFSHFANAFIQSNSQYMNT